MQSPVRMEWVRCPLTNCFHAADAVMRNRPLADPALHETLASPVEEFRAVCSQSMISPMGMMAHLIPLSVRNRGISDVTQMALVKMAGRERAGGLAIKFRAAISHLDSVYRKTTPPTYEVRETSEPPSESSLQNQWLIDSPRLLTRIQRWVGPDLLVSEATAALLAPAQGGAGAAYLGSNTVTIESLETDPAPELPEVVRLAWLVSTLNLDLPRYTEGMRPDRIGLVSAVAMAPIAMSAHLNEELVPCEESAIDAAVRAWLEPIYPLPADITQRLARWWQVYCSQRPSMATALRALEQLLR